MKRTTGAVAIASAAALLLSACGDTADTADEPTTAAEETAEDDAAAEDDTATETEDAAAGDDAAATSEGAAPAASTIHSRFGATRNDSSAKDTAAK